MMAAEFSDELISAYLDGELTADEQARVEELLRTSPALRQELEDLRALREDLQALPQYRLGDDFAQRVLRRAARELPPGGHASLGAADVARRPDELRAFPWRGVLWAALAVAASLLLMLFAPHSFDPPRVAQQGAAPKEESSQPTAEAGQAAADLNGLSPATDPAVGRSEESRADRMSLTNESGKKELDALRDHPAAPPSPTGREAAPPAVGFEGGERVRSGLGQVAAPAPEPAGMRQQLAKDAPPASARPGAVRPAPQGAFAPRPREGRAAKTNQELLRGSILEAVQRTGTHLVVELAMAPELPADHFDQSLGRQNIALTSEIRAWPDRLARVAAPPRRPEDAAAPHAEKPAAATSAPPQLVYVEATPEQIDAAVAELVADRNQVQLVAITPRELLGETANRRKGAGQDKRQEEGREEPGQTFRSDAAQSVAEGDVKSDLSLDLDAVPEAPSYADQDRALDAADRSFFQRAGNDIAPTAGGVAPLFDGRARETDEAGGQLQSELKSELKRLAQLRRTLSDHETTRPEAERAWTAAAAPQVPAEPVQPAEAPGSFDDSLERVPAGQQRGLARRLPLIGGPPADAPSFAAPAADDNARGRDVAASTRETGAAPADAPQPQLAQQPLPTVRVLFVLRSLPRAALEVDAAAATVEPARK